MLRCGWIKRIGERDGIIRKILDPDNAIFPHEWGEKAKWEYEEDAVQEALKREQVQTQAMWDMVDKSCGNMWQYIQM